MPGLLDSFLARTRHATAGGGILSGIGGGTGILSTAVGPLQSRLASIQAAGSPQAKLQALTTTLGMRLKSGGILSGLGAGSSGSSGGGTSTDASFQVAGASRIYSSPTKPPGIEYK
ncbi:MAG: hypothetical protein WAV54_13315 [Acidimicrobiales bacterium]